MWQGSSKVSSKFSSQEERAELQQSCRAATELQVVKSVVNSVVKKSERGGGGGGGEVCCSSYSRVV
jgi:hypothetical protein